jgi:hypothetical protein
MAKECPLCRLVNPPEALRCDCGYDFAAGFQMESYLSNKDKERIASDEKAKRDLARIGTILSWFGS